MAEANSSRIVSLTPTCVVCGGEVARKGKRGRVSFYCSDECRRVAIAAKTGKNGARTATKACRICGAEFSYEQRKGGRQAFCSDACREEGKRQNVRAYQASHKRAPARRNMEKHRRDCAICGREFATDNARTITCGAACGKRLSDWSRSTAVRAERYAHFGWCETPDDAYRRRRRIAIAGGEKVGPVEVFARDGWRCHLCGRKTPKKLRGTLNPRAPEIDHILPLAQGGSHAYSNVACACRECNSRKREKPMGQLLLFARLDAA